MAQEKKISRLLRLFHRQLRVLQHISSHSPKSFLLGWIFVLAILTPGLSKLQFLLSIDDLIDPDFRTYQSLKKVNENFEDQNSAILTIESPAGFSNQLLCRLQHWMFQEADSNPQLFGMTSTFGIREFIFTDSRVNLKSPIDVDCEHPSPLVTAETERGFQTLAASPWSGILTTSTPSITIVAQFKNAQHDKYGSLNPATITAIQTSFAKAFSDIPSSQVFWAGVGTFKSELLKGFDKTQALNGLMFLLSLLVCRFLLGSWHAGVIYSVTVMTTMHFVYGLMGALNIPIDVLTNATGLILLIACLEDFVFMAYAMMTKKWSLRRALRHYMIPSFYTSLTTLIGFGSLMTSDLGIIRRFGLVTGIGAMVEWFVIFILLNSALQLFPRWIEWKAKPLRSWKLPFSFHLPSISKPVAWFFALAVLASLFGIHRLRVEDSPDAFFKKNHIMSKTAQHFLKTRGWNGEVSLLLNTATPEAILREKLNEVRKLPHVALVEDPFSTLDFFKKNHNESEIQIINQYWESYPFNRHVTAPSGVQRAELYLNSMEMKDTSQLMSDVAQICSKGECELAGSLISYNEFGQRVLKTLFSSLGVSLLLVAAVIFLISGHLSLREKFFCILASIWGALALLSVFLIFDLPLMFVTSLCASVLVGLAGDNITQFIFAKKNLRAGIIEMTPACRIVTLAMILLTSVLFLSDFAPLAKLGGLIILGFILAYVGDVVILQGLLPKKDKTL